MSTGCKRTLVGSKEQGARSKEEEGEGVALQLGDKWMWYILPVDDINILYSRDLIRGPKKKARKRKWIISKLEMRDDRGADGPMGGN